MKPFTEDQLNEALTLLEFSEALRQLRPIDCAVVEACKAKIARLSALLDHQHEDQFSRPADDYLAIHHEAQVGRLWKRLNSFHSQRAAFEEY